MAASLKGELLFVLTLYENIAVLDFTLKSLPCRRCLCRNYTGARHHVSAALVCFSVRVSMNQLGGKKTTQKDFKLAASETMCHSYVGGVVDENGPLPLSSH